MTRPLLHFGVAVAALVATGCATAAIAGGVVVAGLGSAILFSGCDESASVQVWDNTSSHPVCDAVVTADSETGSHVTFSPCFQAYLGTGVWHVTATKPGFPIAKGIITVEEKRRCSEPTYHSLDLTLGSDATAPSIPASAAPPPPPPPTPVEPGPPPASAPTPPQAAAPSTPPTPSTAPPAPPASPSPSSPAPSATVPSAAFSSQAPSEVPAPPTR